MKIITVCGSIKFKNEMKKYQDEMHAKGYWVLLPENMDIDIQKVDKRVKMEMDKLHLSKIDCADYVVIFNKDNYIGESTEKELEYAIDKKKKILLTLNIDMESGGRLE